MRGLSLMRIGGPLREELWRAMRLPAKKMFHLSRAPDSPPYFDGDSQARLTEYGTVVKLPSFRSVSHVSKRRRCAQRYALVANAEVANSSDERIARVEDLCIAGACLAMTNPFFQTRLGPHQNSHEHRVLSVPCHSCPFNARDRDGRNVPRCNSAFSSCSTGMVGDGRFTRETTRS